MTPQTDRAEDFIRRHKNGPFFLYLPHFGVHAPWEAKKDLVEKFAAKPPVGEQKNPGYAAMIYSVDESVGRIMAVLGVHPRAYRGHAISASVGMGPHRHLRGCVRQTGSLPEDVVTVMNPWRSCPPLTSGGMVVHALCVVSASHRMVWATGVFLSGSTPFWAGFAPDLAGFALALVSFAPDLVSFAPDLVGFGRHIRGFDVFSG